MLKTYLVLSKCIWQNAICKIKKIQLWKTQCSNGISDIDANCISTKTCKLPGQKLNILNFNVGDKCVVTCDKNVYTGEISNIFGTDLEVNLMILLEVIGNGPKKFDVLLYPIENVIKKISPPVIVGSREQFKFEEL